MPVVKNKYRTKKEYSIVMGELLTAARYRGYVTYQELANLLGLPVKGSHMGAQLGHVLGEISEDEVIQGRPMLSALAVNVGGQPGPGFFALAEKLGLFKGGSREEQEAFWQQTREDLYSIWKRRLHGAS